MFNIFPFGIIHKSTFFQAVMQGGSGKQHSCNTLHSTALGHGRKSSSRGPSFTDKALVV